MTLEAFHGAGFRGVIPAAVANARARELGVGVPRLMTMLLPYAAEYAKPPISNFRVGCVSRGLSGALYYGTNLEFAGEALSFTVHAEQSSVTNAWTNGEEGIDLIAVNAAPCGYCRQFLNELVTANQLVIAMPDETRPLSDLLPNAFGPRDLGIDGGLMQPAHHDLVIAEGDALAQTALDAANMSYAPYSKSYAGVAVRTSAGAVYAGPYAENAAFNPSMSPLEVALSRLNLAGEPFESIEDAVLVHVDSLHSESSRVVLRAVSDVPLRLVQARNSR